MSQPAWRLHAPAFALPATRSSPPRPPRWALPPCARAAAFTYAGVAAAAKAAAAATAGVAAGAAASQAMASLPPVASLGCLLLAGLLGGAALVMHRTIGMMHRYEFSHAEND